jgi:phage terminase Nu1 subunit (DNA packaging protein)
MLNLTRRRIEQLVEEGMPRAGRGQYDLEACVKWYVASLQERANGALGPDGIAGRASWDYERTRVMRADAELKEMEVAERRGELVSVARVGEMWDEAFGRLRARMLASIGKTAPRAVGLKSVRRANKVLEEIVREALEAAAEVAEDEVM